MYRLYIYNIIYSTVTAFAVTLLLGCGQNSGALKKLQQKSDGPSSEGTGIDLHYIDSGRVKAHLKTSYLRDFSNEQFAYYEFPEGIDLIFKDDNNEENFIRSDYAIQYKETGLIDLQNNVVLITKGSDTLKTQQLYYDQKNSWVFTDHPYTLIKSDGSQNKGGGFDSSEDFTDFVSLNNRSKQYIKDEESEEENDTIR